MNITFGKSAYVPGTPEDILDLIDHNLSTSATGEDSVIVTMEALTGYILQTEFEIIQNTEKDFSSPHLENLYQYLKEAMDKINDTNDNTPIGDIFFVS